MSQKSETETTTQLKSLNGHGDSDIYKFEFFRGETPSNIGERCLKLCKDYLSGNWCQQTVDTIVVKRITGGQVNQLYYCAIKDPDPNYYEEIPQEVVIKLYGNNVLGLLENSRIRDVVTALVYSKNDLGPKIYGLFEAGQIQKYYKHRIFTLDEQKDPVLRDKVLKTLAKIHSLDIPLKKDPNWLSALLHRSYTESYDNFDISQEIIDYNCETLKSIDLKSEIDYCLRVAQTAESPVVFTHNDFRSSNILVTEPNDEIIICDYDVSGYGYRGYDFLALFREWGRKQFDFVSIMSDWMHRPSDIRPVEVIPFKDEEIKPLIDIYVEECVRIQGKSFTENDNNSVRHIIKEIKIFLLLQTLFIIFFYMNNDQNKDGIPFNRKVCMEMVDKGIENYFSIKKALKEQNLIQ